MPKNNPEEINEGLPQDFIAAAEADGVAVPAAAKQPAAPDPKPTVQVVSEEVDPKPAPQQAEKPARSPDFVDFKTATPEEIENRFNRMYRQVKGQDETARRQGEMLEKLLKDKQKAEAELVEQRSKDAIQGVRDKLKNARDLGNSDEEDRLLGQLVELQAEASVAKRVPATPQAPAPQQREAPKTAYDTLSASDKAEITRWANTADAEGNLMRPWASRDDNVRAPLASQLLARILADETHADMTMAEKLSMVDEQMGTQGPVARRGASPVMAPNLTNRAPASTPKITAQQARVAKRMFPHMKDQDAYRAYLDGGGQ